MRYLSCVLVAVFVFAALSQPAYSLSAADDSQLPAYGTIFSMPGEETEFSLEFTRTDQQLGHTVMIVQVGDFISSTIDSWDYAISAGPYILKGYLPDSPYPKSYEVSITVASGSTLGHFKDIKIDTR